MWQQHGTGVWRRGPESALPFSMTAKAWRQSSWRKPSSPSFPRKPKKGLALDYGLRVPLRSETADALACEALPIRARITPVSVFFCPILWSPPPLSVSNWTRRFRAHSMQVPNPRVARRRRMPFAMAPLQEIGRFRCGIEECAALNESRPTERELQRFNGPAVTAACSKTPGWQTPVAVVHPQFGLQDVFSLPPQP